MLRVLSSLCLILLLSSCGGLNPLGLLGGGGGPTVNSNAQIGKENRQAAVSYEQEDNYNAGRDVITTETIKEVETGTVEELKISNTNIPIWVIVLLLLGWLLPTPTQMGQGLYQLLTLPFKRKDDGV